MPQREMQPSIRVGQIIIVALMMGAGVFAAMVPMIIQGKQNPEEMPILLFIAAGNSLTMIIIWFAAPFFFSKAIQQKVSESEWATLSEDEQFLATLWLYQRMTIVRGAVLEGAIYMNLLFLIVLQDNTFWAIAATLFFFLLLTFPTQSKYENWVRREIEKSQLM